MRALDIPGIDQLSISEKILLVEDLWDVVAADASSIPVPQSHLEELDKRIDRFASNPGNLLSLDELRSRIEGKK